MNERASKILAEEEGEAKIYETKLLKKMSVNVNSSSQNEEKGDKTKEKEPEK